MKQQHGLLVLIIYIVFCSTVFSQNFELHLKHTSKEKNTPKDSVLTTTARKDSLTSRRDQYLQFLKKEGYLTLSYQALIRRNDSQWDQTIDLGKKIDSIELQISYPKDSELNFKQVSLSRKRKYHIKTKQIDSLINDIESNLNNDGRHFNTFTITNFELSKKNKATAVLQISTSRTRTIDGIVIKGYTKYPRNSLDRIINRKKILNSENIEAIEKNIKSQNTATITKPTEILYKEDSTKLYVYLNKKKANRAEGMLGLNNSNATNKTEINGYLDLELNNNLDKAEQFKILYRNDGNEITNLNAGLTIPDLLFQKIGIKTSLQLSRRDSVYSNTTFNTGLFYNVGLNSSIGLNYHNYNSTDIREAVTNEDITTNGANVEYTYTLFTNTSGIMDESTVAKASIGLQERTINTTSNNQYVFNATFSKLWHLTDRMKFFNLLNSGILASPDLRLNELYQIGGINSIRGFAQNTIDTSRYLTLLNEYRWSLNEEIYLYSILDFGLFRNFQTSKTENLYGLGAGIAILTQSGIVTFSLANGSFQKANLDLSSLIAHINLRIRF